MVGGARQHALKMGSFHLWARPRRSARSFLEKRVCDALLVPERPLFKAFWGLRVDPPPLRKWGPGPDNNGGTGPPDLDTAVFACGPRSDKDGPEARRVRGPPDRSSRAPPRHGTARDVPDRRDGGRNSGGATGPRNEDEAGLVQRGGGGGTWGSMRSRFERAGLAMALRTRTGLQSMARSAAVGLGGQAQEWRRPGPAATACPGPCQATPTGAATATAAALQTGQ